MSDRPASDHTLSLDDLSALLPCERDGALQRLLTDAEAAVPGPSGPPEPF